MARIQLEFPEPVIFKTELGIRVDDINYGGHVGNDRFLTLVQEARIRMFRAMGYRNEASIEEGRGIIVTDAALIYKSELFLGDEIQVEIGIADEKKFAVDIYYRITNLSNGKISALVKTAALSYNYVNRTIVPFPEYFFDKLRGLREGTN